MDIYTREEGDIYLNGEFFCHGDHQACENMKEMAKTADDLYKAQCGLISMMTHLVNNLLHDDQFRVVDSVLERLEIANNPDVSNRLLIALLTVTKPFESDLICRDKFYDRVEYHLLRGYQDGTKLTDVYEGLS
jgi:hypothetical protein